MAEMRGPGELHTPPTYSTTSTPKILTVESSWSEILAELQQIKNQLDQIKGANLNANPHQN